MSYTVEKNKPRECEKCKHVISNDSISKCPKCGNEIGVVLDPYDVLRNGRCGGCNWPIYGDELHLKFLLKKATWNNPIGVIPNLKEGIEDVPRAMGLLCKTCKENNVAPKYAVYFYHGKIKYVPVDQLEDTFEVTKDMIKEPEK